MPPDCTGPSGPPSSSPRSSEDDPERDLSGALHEVSNALTVVVGWLERARADASLSDEVRRALEIAHTRALDGRVIARRAIGAAVESVSREDSLEALVSEALTGVLPEAAERGVELSLATLDGVGQVLVDEARVALQIVTNLLLNAIAFSPPGGVVRLSATAHDGEVAFAVQDEGPGFASDRKDKIFVRGRTTREGGAGIGLVHARSLARRYGGELVLEPSERGARFLLRWPRAAARSSRAVSPRAGATLAGMRVLVLEDDAAVLILLETALTARGADVVCARTRRELTEALDAEPFHAALVDLSPIAGDEAGAIDCLLGVSPAARIILISGSAATPPEAVVRVASAWVRKPFDLSEIVASLSGDAKLIQAS